MSNEILSQIKSKKAKDRYELILSVSLELFLKNGFENTSLNDIISKSGGSLSTIYTYFGSKEGLFKAIIDRGVRQFLTEVENQIYLDSSDDLEKFLFKFGEEFLNIVWTKDSLLLKKLILNESFKDKSQIVDIFYESGVKKVNQILTDFFSKPTVKPRFKSDDLELLAFRFCYLLEEPFTVRSAILKRHLNMNKQEKKEWVKECVEFFLSAALK
ncbi:TetR/AcrR family transcriptional regulator [Campylobacter fetus]|uniref:TetR/AcrR family transcriptional regulator n=1 Tax=Campylobacter fetus TaxID=196 RepID=UPI000FCB96EC|nr:TetR/AcrR family transcriptional regulator [Campylobacter fetus]QQF52649.1 TetR/AcrR family transcriptional regulator [Campylobacter fetus subsp. venerealis]RUT49474.1 TetR family transcriptional regulator [Campylobacter fetus]RUT49733.1 TetR family transcriptional regulator [Campylobacter fetus]